jgi:hypothetical protein
MFDFITPLKIGQCRAPNVPNPLIGKSRTEDRNYVRLILQNTTENPPVRKKTSIKISQCG